VVGESPDVEAVVEVDSVVVVPLVDPPVEEPVEVVGITLDGSKLIASTTNKESPPTETALNVCCAAGRSGKSPMVTWSCTSLTYEDVGLSTAIGPGTRC
jgi:hypothetical protein